MRKARLSLGRGCRPFEMGHRAAAERRQPSRPSEGELSERSCRCSVTGADQWGGLDKLVDARPPPGVTSRHHVIGTLASTRRFVDFCLKSKSMLKGEPSGTILSDLSIREIYTLKDSLA